MEGIIKVESGRSTAAGPRSVVSQRYVLDAVRRKEFPEEKTRRKTSAEEVRSTGYDAWG